MRLRLGGASKKHALPESAGPCREASMISQDYALRQFFHDVVAECYGEHVGINDREVTTYIADLLTDFCISDRLYPIRDIEGRPVKEVAEMLLVSDPVNGT